MRNQTGILLGAISLSFLQTACASRPVPTREALYDADMAAGRCSGIHIAGRVLDQRGTPLNDVTVSRRSEIDETTQTVNSSFALDYTNDICIGVTFEKTGYEPTNRLFEITPETPRDGSGNRRLVATNQIFVLRRK